MSLMDWWVTSCGWGTTGKDLSVETSITSKHKGKIQILGALLVSQRNCGLKNNNDKCCKKDAKPPEWAPNTPKLE